MDFDPADVEPCPLCWALVMDMYEHVIWHGYEPLGPRFRRRYEKDAAAQIRLRSRQQQLRNRSDHI